MTKNKIAELFEDPNARAEVWQTKISHREMQSDLKVKRQLQAGAPLSEALKRVHDEWARRNDMEYKVSINQEVEDNIVSFTWEGTHTAGKIPEYIVEIVPCKKAE